jgi:alkylation response protein AidB-like acyl-CoA dehydrogenase
MSVYTAPVAEMEFVLNELADLRSVAELPGFEEATPDLVRAVLEEAGKLAGEVLAPLNNSGDQQGANVNDGVVQTPDGWIEAYRTFVDAGWNSLGFEPQYGGQGLPWLLSSAIQEMWSSSNLAFGLCPLLTQGAVHALQLHGSRAQKDTYLPNLVSGEWTGTMNLTEPQAGSDLGAVRTRAERDGDRYRISGQKIFITYGEHDLTENIIHLVLARLPDAPAGVKGISLFIVPKYLVNDDGTLGARNDVRCVSLEHKLGIHASPTAVMSYGDNEGAIGFLVGEENRGLEYMFSMMNLARHSVGLQGVGIAEMAYQQARDYAAQRVQGRVLGAVDGDRTTINHHPDVRRMLMSMRARTEATRALNYYTGAVFDKAHRTGDDDERRRQQALLDLLIPIAKGWATELGVEIASLGIQVHGGMGYMEETGAAQILRDSRITPIYEGTTGIQAGDLIGRKILRDGGAVLDEFLNQMRSLDNELGAAEDTSLQKIRAALDDGIDAVTQAKDWLLAAVERDPRLPAAASVPMLQLFGTVTGGWLMARAALAARRKLDANEGDPDFYRAKITTAEFYASHELPQAQGHLRAIRDGSDATLALAAEQL